MIMKLELTAALECICAENASLLAEPFRQVPS